MKSGFTCTHIKAHKSLSVIRNTMNTSKMSIIKDKSQNWFCWLKMAQHQYSVWMKFKNFHGSKKGYFRYGF